MKRKIFFLTGYLFVLLLFGNLGAKTGNLQFDRITTEQGLFNNTVSCILQDRQGFMWIGTWNGGLNRYDGICFKSYTHNPMDTNSISGNTVTAILEDNQGFIWVATITGLNRFDPDTESFLRFKHDSGDPHSLSSNNICSIYKDQNGFIWIGTHDRGLNKFDHLRGQFKRFVCDPNNPNSLSHNHVTNLVVDKKGRLWIGTGGGGLNKLDIDRNRWTRYLHDPQNPLSLSSNLVSSIFEDKRGNMWIGTLGRGLNKLDPESEVFTRYIGSRDNPHGLQNNYIFSILEDRDNRLWIGTAFGVHEFIRDKNIFIHHHHIPGDSKSYSLYSAMFIFEDRSGLLWMGSETGINLLDKGRQKFAHIYDEHGLMDRNVPSSLSHNYVEVIHESQDGIIWIGTLGGGLNAFDRESKKFTFYKKKPEDPHSICCNMISSIYEEGSGNLWLGTRQGLNYFNRKEKTFLLHQHDPENPNSLTSNHITCMVGSRDDTLWIGTENGLDKFDPLNRTFHHFKHDPKNTNSLSSDNITSLLVDHRQTLWVGTFGSGLSRYSESDNTFIHYKNKPGNPTSLKGYDINTLYETSSGTIWVGTTDGLNMFFPETESFLSFTVEDGLPHHNITAILEDDSENLWISTSKGISKFNPAEKTFRNYSSRDGLQNGEFTSACCKARSGEMFFGGTHGINSFFPNQVFDNPVKPPVVFTSFTIHTRGKNWKKIEPIKEKVMLSYRDTISIQFTSLCYNNPSRNQYAYKISSHHTDWIYLGNNHEIILSGLEPGEHRLHVKGSNHDGVWNQEGTSIELIISPPFWKTWWFRIIAVTFFVLLFLVWHRTRMKNLAHRLKTETAVSQFLSRHDISKREREIVKLMLQGKSNREIEDLLFISHHTVKNHVYNIFQKLKINSRGQLVNMFREYLLSREND